MKRGLELDEGGVEEFHKLCGGETGGSYSRRGDPGRQVPDVELPIYLPCLRQRGRLNVLQCRCRLSRRHLFWRAVKSVLLPNPHNSTDMIPVLGSIARTAFMTLVSAARVAGLGFRRFRGRRCRPAPGPRLRPGRRSRVGPSDLSSPIPLARVVLAVVRGVLPVFGLVRVLVLVPVVAMMMVAFLLTERSILVLSAYLDCRGSALTPCAPAAPPLLSSSTNLR